MAGSTTELSPPLCPPIFEGDYWITECLRLIRLAHTRTHTQQSQSSSSSSASSLSSSRGHHSHGHHHLHTGSLGPPTAPTDAHANTRRARELIKHIHTHTHASPFHTPVDPVRLHLPTYTTVVKNPMDLQTLREKLRSGKYPTLLEFAEDMRLIFRNAMLFNPPTNTVHIWAKELLGVFEACLRELLVEVCGHTLTLASPVAVAAAGDKDKDKQLQQQQNSEVNELLRKYILGDITATPANTSAGAGAAGNSNTSKAKPHPKPQSPRSQQTPSSPRSSRKTIAKPSAAGTAAPAATGESATAGSGSATTAATALATTITPSFGTRTPSSEGSGAGTGAGTESQSLDMALLMPRTRTHSDLVDEPVLVPMDLGGSTSAGESSNVVAGDAGADGDDECVVEVGQGVDIERKATPSMNAVVVGDTPQSTNTPRPTLSLPSLSCLPQYDSTDSLGSVDAHAHAHAQQQQQSANTVPPPPPQQLPPLVPHTDSDPHLINLDGEAEMDDNAEGGRCSHRIHIRRHDSMDSVCDPYTHTNAGDEDSMMEVTDVDVQTSTTLTHTNMINLGRDWNSRSIYDRATFAPITSHTHTHTHHSQSSATTTGSSSSTDAGTSSSTTATTTTITTTSSTLSTTLPASSSSTAHAHPADTAADNTPPVVQWDKPALGLRTALSVCADLSKSVFRLKDDLFVCRFTNDLSHILTYTPEDLRQEELLQQHLQQQLQEQQQQLQLMQQQQQQLQQQLQLQQQQLMAQEQAQQQPVKQETEEDNANYHHEEVTAMDVSEVAAPVPVVGQAVAGAGAGTGAVDAAGAVKKRGRRKGSTNKNKLPGGGYVTVDYGSSSTNTPTTASDNAQSRAHSTSSTPSLTPIPASGAGGTGGASTMPSFVSRSHHQLSSHVLQHLHDANIPRDTTDPDPYMSHPLIDNRHTFLEVCTHKHWQFDTLRHAKHSSMCLLFYLHQMATATAANPEPEALASVVAALASTCAVCGGKCVDVRWHCDVCVGVDICNECVVASVRKTARENSGNGSNANDATTTAATTTLLTPAAIDACDVHEHLLTPHRVTFG